MGIPYTINITAYGDLGKPAQTSAVLLALSDMWAVLVGRDPYIAFPPQRMVRDTVTAEFLAPSQSSTRVFRRQDAANVLRTVLSIEANCELREIARAELV